LNICFAGAVLQGQLSNSLPAGFSIKSSQVPLAGTPEQLGFPAIDGCAIYLFSPQSQAYQTFIFDALEGGWLPFSPNIQVGQAFFVHKNSPAVWIRNFSIN
jgi:hypothetical protein